MNVPALAQREALLERLLEGLTTLGAQPPPGAPERLLDYVALLLQWNRAYNLTAITDPWRILSHHLLDSLSVAEHLNGPNILDVGTGAGLPGIPLAVVHPEFRFVLLDSNGKKTRFLFHVITTLGLGNVSVHEGRAETFRHPQGFDTVVARAVASLGELIASSGHLLAEGGILLAMKSELGAGELESVTAPYNVGDCLGLDVPGIESVRQLVRINRAGPPQALDGKRM